MGKSNRESYNAYMRKYVNRRYHERRMKAIELLGGSCVFCGKKETLQIDHIDPNSKTLDLSRVLHGANWDAIKDELKKCQLLCEACHIKKSKTDGSTYKNVAKGERVNHAKLTASDVKLIRQKYESGNYTQQQLADDYKVNRSAIGQIVRRLTWKHV